MSREFQPTFCMLLAFTGSTAASVGISASTAGSLQAAEISNLSTSGAFCAFGSSSIAATVPTTSASTNGFYVPAGPSRSPVRYVIPPNANSYISAISTGTALVGVLAITVGTFDK